MHLAWCRECREELAALAGLPGLLRRVPGDEAERLFAGEADAAGQADPAFPADPPDGGTLPRLLSRTARTRRTRRWLAAAATAAAVAVATGSGVAAASGLAAGARPIPWETFSARNDATLASATVRYAPAPWGARVEVRVSGIAPGTPCQLRVTGSHAQRRIAGSWTVVRGEDGTWIPASTSFPAESVSGFAVLSGHRTLVTVPAAES
jgi:hypothetical protein